MVGKRDNKTEEVDGEYFKFLKQNNKALAKALTEERLTSKQVLDERNLLQKKLHTAVLLNMRYETILNQLLVQSKHTLPNCLALSDNIGQLIKLCSDGVQLSKSIDIEHKEKQIVSYNVSRSASPGVPNKTNAVKPMVGGHVIFRPTINLWRLSETEHNELTRNIESQSAELSTDSQTPSNCTSTNGNFDFLSTPPQPIRGFSPQMYEDEIQNTEINSPDTENSTNLPELEDTNNNANSLTIRSNGLEVVKELSEESDNDSTENANTSLTEARIVVDPIPLSILNSNKITKRKIAVAKNYDPLEGPSTLLDNIDYCSARYVSKPRVATIANNKYTYVSDSDSNNEEISFNIIAKRKQKKLISKRKSGEKTGSEEHNKNNKKRLKNNVEWSQSQPVVLLTQLTESDVLKHQENPNDSLNKSMERISFDTRPKRSKMNMNFKEISLKCKLRRA